MKLILSLWLVVSSSLCYAASPAFHLQNGDLLFQDLNCGEFCDSIDSVTYGYGNSYVSHVAMVIDSSESHPQVIEAGSRGVIITSLNQFLAQSLDESNHPRVMVGRINSVYQPLIESALHYSIAQLGKPYNSSFIAANGKAFYCSELIDNAFSYANHGIRIFRLNKMDFTDGKSSQILPLWQQYYQSLHVTPPQGFPGTNPGMMSRESFITIVHYYGKLRTHNN